MLVLILFYMVDTKSLEQTNSAWKNAQGRVAAAYSQGVDNAKDVINKAIAGEQNYAAGVQDAVAKGSRAKGLAKVTDQDWRNAAKTKGAIRIVPGMVAATGKYSQGMSQNLATIQSVSIPPRTQDGMANIDNRLKPIAAALMAQKGR